MEKKLDNRNKNEVLKGYKHSPIGFIPEDWHVTELEKVAKIKRGRFSPRPRNDPKYYGGNIPFVQTSDVTNSNGKVNYYTQTLNDEGLAVSILFPKGTILMTIASNIGHTAILELDMACPDSLVGIMCNGDYDNEFLNYYLKFVQKRIEYIAPGAQKNINIEFLNPLPVIQCKLQEQIKIKSLLLIWDKAIEKTSQLITQKENRKKWLMQQLLTGKKRLKGFKGEWKEVKMSEVFERVTRKNEERNNNVLTISAQQGLINQEKFFNKQVASEILDNYFLLHKGEFAYNKSYSNGYPMGAIKKLNNYDKGVVTTLYICFKLKNGKEYSPDFFEQYFEGGLLVAGLEKIAHEGGRAHGLLNVIPSDFFNLKLSIPAGKEQFEIANVLQAADSELKILKSKLEQLKEQKKGLMQVLLTGKKRLKI